MDNRKEKMFEKLILMGVIEPAAMDSNTGEMLFSFSKDVAEKFPGIAEAISNKMSGTIMSLWSKGFVELKYVEGSLDPLVFLTDRCDDEFAISVLPEFENVVLLNIIDYFRQNEV